MNAKRAGVKPHQPVNGAKALERDYAAGEAGAGALAGFTSALLPPPDESPPTAGELFGERGGRPSMMSLI